MNDKKELRRKFSLIRSSSADDAKNKCIAKRLLSHEKVLSADLVLLYASFRSEVDTWAIADELFRKNIPAAFPKCGENGIMTFHLVTSADLLQASPLGIREPDSTLPYPVFTDRTVCIVPALAFTEKGERLGYGGGFYDRFLSANPQIYAIGLAFGDCLADTLPTEAHDIKVDSVITEERTVLCNAE